MNIQPSPSGSSLIRAGFFFNFSLNLIIRPAAGAYTSATAFTASREQTGSPLLTYIGSCLFLSLSEEAEAQAEGEEEEAEEDAEEGVEEGDEEEEVEAQAGEEEEVEEVEGELEVEVEEEEEEEEDATVSINTTSPSSSAAKAEIPTAASGPSGVKKERYS
ncbi:hypothetical protein EAH_00036950 [Eimeria acervulina]|uniref:Uncharacterized protein n=1 Tax=Eimeria acervulina TaxID=5801 RepID=U6GJL1_EIMAC|nr:hypothetical protein EAH_00036950 [Eimeria acervulina]CDI78779.1 hypothetical protein EAH_00036950 [Eimeria acervulina]